MKAKILKPVKTAVGDLVRICYDKGQIKNHPAAHVGESVWKVEGFDTGGYAMVKCAGELFYVRSWIVVPKPPTYDPTKLDSLVWKTMHVGFKMDIPLRRMKKEPKSKVWVWDPDGKNKTRRISR